MYEGTYILTNIRHVSYAAQSQLTYTHAYEDVHTYIRMRMPLSLSELTFKEVASAKQGFFYWPNKIHVSELSFFFVCQMYTNKY